MLLFIAPKSHRYPTSHIALAGLWLWGSYKIPEKGLMSTILRLRLAKGSLTQGNRQSQRLEFIKPGIFSCFVRFCLSSNCIQHPFSFRSFIRQST